MGSKRMWRRAMRRYIKDDRFGLDVFRSGFGRMRKTRFEEDISDVNPSRHVKKGK